MIRRNIIRYCCLTQVLVLRDISMRVRKRFPNLDSVVEAGKQFCYKPSIVRILRFSLAPRKETTRKSAKYLSQLLDTYSMGVFNFGRFEKK